MTAFLIATRNPDVIYVTEHLERHRKGSARQRPVYHSMCKKVTLMKYFIFQYTLRGGF